jgi:hypothetical protein
MLLEGLVEKQATFSTTSAIDSSVLQPTLSQNAKTIKLSFLIFSKHERKGLYAWQRGATF